MATSKKATAKASSESAEVVVIPAIDIRTAQIKIVGDTPLIMHKWDEKNKQILLDDHMKKAKTAAHEPKDPVAEFIKSMYWLEGEPKDKTEAGFEKAIANGARFGFPATAVKAAAVSAAYRAELTKNKVSMNGAFHILGEFIEIHGIPEMREDIVRIGQGKPDLRYRGEFPIWWASFTVKYNASIVSLEQLANIINLGGFACGLGEWRTEKGGTFGSFHVE